MRSNGKSAPKKSVLRLFSTVSKSGTMSAFAEAVRSAHDAKIILDRNQLDNALLDAIAHAHDAEVPGL